MGLTLRPEPYLARALAAAAPAAAPFSRVNGPTDGPTSGPYNGWTVYSADAISDDTSFTVSRDGFDATGAATSYTETLYVTRQARQVYPNQASLQANTYALSDWIYSTDTPPGSATNNSDVTSPKPIANWVSPHRSVVGNSLTIEVNATHRNARQGRQVACVIVRATDGTNTVTATVAETTISNRTGDQHAVLVYSATLDITSLNAGLITVNAKVYPWIGGAASVLDSADQSAGRDFSPRYFYKNTTLAASPYYAYVKSGGTAGGVFSTTAATAEATPFGSIVQMFDAINAGAAARCDGVIVRLGDDGGTPWVLTGSASARNQDCAYITITRDPNVARANARCSFGAAAFRPRLGSGGTLDAPLATGCIRFADVQVTRTGTSSFTGEAATLLEIIFDDVTYDAGSYNAAWLSNAHDYVYGMTATNAATASGWSSASAAEHRIFRGLTVNRGGNAIEGWNLIGSTIDNPGALASLTSSSGRMVDFNRFNSPSATVALFSPGQSSDFAGASFKQNLVEYTSATDNYALGVSPDNATGDNTHVCIHNNTIAGFNAHGRSNIFYDEGATARTSWLHSCVGNIHTQINTKGDVFVSNGARIGFFTYLHGVGCRGEFSMFKDAGTFAQRYPGLAANIGTSNTVRNNPTFTNYQGTVNATTAGAGGGTYTIETGSPAEAMVVEPVLSHDLAGVPRAANDDSAGAYAAAVEVVLAQISFDMGALTPSGMGDRPIDGTVASQVDKDGIARTDLNTSGGVATAGSTWVANCAARSPYTVTTDTTIYTITATANDYHVGKQADWDGTGGISKIAASTLTGKRILLRPGLSIEAGVSGANGAPISRANYGTSGQLIIESEDHADPATFTDGLATLRSRYIIFRHIRMTVPDFAGGNSRQNTPKCVLLSSNSTFYCTDIWFDGCEFIGTDIDPNGDFTGADKAGVMTPATGDGSTTTFTFTSPYASISNVEANAVVVTAGAVTGTSGAANTTTITGTGIASGSVTYNTGAVTVTFSTAPANGVPVTIVYQIAGAVEFGCGDAIGEDAGGYLGNIRITGCTFENVRRGVVLSATPGLSGAGNLISEDLSMTGNFVDKWFELGLSPRYKNGIGLTEVSDNVITRCCSLQSDNENPHADAILFTASYTATTDWPVRVNRNFILRGNARGESAQIAFRDFYTAFGNSGKFFIAELIGNVVNSPWNEGIMVQNAKDCVVLNNTLAWEGTGANYACNIDIGGPGDEKTWSGTHRIERNVCEVLAYGGTPTLTDNVETGNDPASWGTYYDGPTFSAGTRAEALTRFSRKASGPLDLGGTYDVGAIGSGAINWAAANPSSTQGSNNVS